MSRNRPVAEIWWLASYVTAIVFVGSSLGYWREAAILALASALFWQLRSLAKLQRWVQDFRREQSSSERLWGSWAELAEEIKLIQQASDKENQQLQSVVDRVQDMSSVLSDGVLLVDHKSRISWWNAAAESLLRIQELDRGHRVTNFLRDPTFQKYFETQDFFEPLTLESLRTEGQMLLLQIHPYGQGEHVIIVRDITRVAKLEQMRRDFVANVSHELRTPLTVIRGYVETLADFPDLHPTLEKALRQMRDQGMRMTALVNDLITLTKLETDELTGTLDKVDLHQLVSLIINDGASMNQQGHSLVNDVDRSLVLLGSEKELRSAFSNLIINAVKYAGGNEKTCTIRVWSEQKANQINLHIEDDGVGIDPKHIPRLTERFYRVDGGRATSVGGTGLGLAIVKHVLIRHNAVLQVASRPGKGSVFSCCFPLSSIEQKEKSA
jgi:two-component system phosphate regulon sensor histidine kinase PhoR